jgi:SAM-dependent methyltransferase
MTTPAPQRETFDAFEAAGWEQAADAYDEFFGPITHRLIAPVLDATSVTRGTRLLDIACGPGHLVAEAAARGSHVVGIDIAHAMIRRAQATLPHLDFRQGDAHRLPFPDASFDAVTGNFAILHLGDPEGAAAEFARVLAPGGHVALTVWDQPEHARLFGWILDALAAAGAEAPADIPSGPPFFRFSEDGELEALLDANGFEDANVRTITFIHRAASSTAIWAGIVDGTVRTSALIRRQPPAAAQAIRRAFDDLVAGAGSGDEIEIPFAVKLATARTRQPNAAER